MNESLIKEYFLQESPGSKLLKNNSDLLFTRSYRKFTLPYMAILVVTPLALYKNVNI